MRFGLLALAVLTACSTPQSGGIPPACYASPLLMMTERCRKVKAEPDRPKDAFSGLAPVPTTEGRYKGVSLGVVISENSLASFEKNKGTGMFSSVEYSSERLFDGYVKLLQEQFKSANRVDSVEKAAEAGLDLVAVLDLTYELPQTLFATARCSANIGFHRPDGSRLEVVRGEGAKHPRDTPGFILVPRLKRAVDDAAQQCLLGVSKALLDSQALADFSAGKKPAVVSAPVQEAAVVSDVDSPLYRFDPSDKNFALVVGIDKYQSIPRAEFAERDARAVRDHLKALGYPDRNVVFLTGNRAGKSAFEKYVEQWLPANVGEESKLLVYYSGHGAPSVKEGDAYLMPWDADAKFVESTGYPVSRLYAKLNELKAKKIVVALDACFSGAGGRSVLARGVRPLVSKVDTGAAKAGRLAVLSASAADEITGAEVSQGHGLFTYYLLKALNTSRGEASVAALFDYLSPLVRDAARRDNRDQTPQLVAGAADKKSDLK
jgi:hypothetical protein